MTNSPNNSESAIKKVVIKSTYFNNMLQLADDLNNPLELFHYTYEDLAGNWLVDYEGYRLTGEAPYTLNRLYILTLHQMGGGSDRGSFCGKVSVTMFTNAVDGNDALNAVNKELGLIASEKISLPFKGYTQRNGDTICFDCVEQLDAGYDKTFQTEANPSQKPICDKCSCIMELD